MLLAARCGGCGARGASPCATCHAALRPPAPEPTPPGLIGLLTLLRYEGPARSLVARVKYRNQRQGLTWLAEGLAERVAATGAGVDLVTWAPTTAAHVRQRGFDQAEVLARLVARRLGVPAVRLLGRRPGPPQTGRAAEARRSCGPRFDLVRTPPAGAQVLVVDDVVTTGATLRAAVEVLVTAGARPLPAALARTPARPRRGPRESDDQPVYSRSTPDPLEHTRWK